MTTVRTIDDLKDKLWYLASPISCMPDPQLASYEAARMAYALSIEGVRLYSPAAETAMWGQSAGGAANLMTHQEYMERDFVILDRCDGVLVYAIPGWEGSLGIKMEIDRAREAGKPVVVMQLHYVPLANGCTYAISLADGAGETLPRHRPMSTIHVMATVRSGWEKAAA